MTSNRVFLCAHLEQLFVNNFQNKIKNIQSGKIIGSLILSRAHKVYLVAAPQYEIVGNVYELDGDMNLTWPVVDEFIGASFIQPHKALFFREEVTVKTEAGDQLTWCYFNNFKKLAQPIEVLSHGRWSEFELQPLSKNLTEKQRLYLQKLGAVSGRDIVPIQDLNLYRELMKLELVVDKGRRLALSKLGQEVYKDLLNYE